MSELQNWMNEVSGTEYIWYIKRLSANDTLANDTHQAGPYIPREVLFRIFPSLNRPEVRNPDLWVDFHIASHAERRNIRIVWYNNKLQGGTRNEARLTNFGGKASALLDPENTGALSIFAFLLEGQGKVASCQIWVCRNSTEEDFVENNIGLVEPGTWKTWSSNDAVVPFGGFGEERMLRASCRLLPEEIPAAWVSDFPTGVEIIRKAVELSPVSGLTPDFRLMKRRDCEYEIFRSVEELIELPKIKKGFDNIEGFISRAQTILQRRKARSGRSLELHMREIFIEEGLKEGRDFSHQPESEFGKSPDFLFPSETRYKDGSFEATKLRMLAVKTTCKDRWRQILNEADRISEKHLLTLQEGLSENQFREMKQAGVQLVVPQPLIDAYSKSIRPYLVTVESFISSIRQMNL